MLYKSLMSKPRRQLQTIVARLFILSILSTGPALFAEKAPETALPKTFCQGLLNAGSTPGATNPLLGLREIQEWLKAGHPGSAKLPLFYKNHAYQTLEFEDDLLKPRNETFRNRSVRGVLDRLAQLEEDTTRLRSNETFMAREFRGQELVSKALEPMLRELKNGQPELDRALNNAYMVWTAGASIAIAASSNVFMDPLYQLNSVRLKNQMDDMSLVLEAQDSEVTLLSIVSGQLEAKPNLDQIDEQSLTQNYPHIFYDSIFYVDPHTREPVWLIYYRAFKNRPEPPKPSGRKKREASPLWQGVWEPQLQPVPIPVPVDRPRR